jgi:hypothetical protein
MSTDPSSATIFLLAWSVDPATMKNATLKKVALETGKRSGPWLMTAAPKGRMDREDREVCGFDLALMGHTCGAMADRGSIWLLKSTCKKCRSTS